MCYSGRCEYEARGNGCDGDCIKPKHLPCPNYMAEPDDTDNTNEDDITKGGMMEITKEFLKELRPCGNRWKNYLENYRDWSGTLSEFLCLDKISTEDKLWVFTRKVEGWERMQRMFAVAVAGRACENARPEVRKYYVLVKNRYESVNYDSDINHLKNNEYWAACKAAHRAAHKATYWAADWAADGAADKAAYRAAYRAADKAADRAVDWAADRAADGAADWAAYRAAEREKQLETLKKIVKGE